MRGVHLSRESVIAVVALALTVTPAVTDGNRKRVGREGLAGREIDQWSSLTRVWQRFYNQELKSLGL
jgi:hypothetical protein